MKKAFSLLELIFVIVVMGILAKYGTNILMSTYTSFASSSNNNKLYSNVEQSMKIISNRLQYRLPDSVVVRTNTADPVIRPLSNTAPGDFVFEWIGYDIDGWLGTAANTNPTWSGFIDINNPQARANLTYLESPSSSTVNVNNVITSLRANGSTTTINNAAIFFTGENSDVQTSYGWTAAAPLASQNFAAHRIQQALAGTVTQFSDPTGAGYGGVDVYENYKLAWTAYALSLEDFDGDGARYPANHPLAGQVIRDIVLYYDFQPWEGDGIPVNDRNRRQLLMQNVDTMAFRAIGNSIMLQICTSDLDALGINDGGYSICEEIAIF